MDRFHLLSDSISPPIKAGNTITGPSTTIVPEWAENNCFIGSPTAAAAKAFTMITREADLLDCIFWFSLINTDGTTYRFKGISKQFPHTIVKAGQSFLVRAQKKIVLL